MILINLLPEELRPIKRTPLPYIVTGGALVAALVLMFFMFIAGVTKASSMRADLKQNEDELNKLKAVVDEYNGLNQKKLNLKDKIATIQEILSDRKIWSEHLHKLASLTPDNIWYSRIRAYSVAQQITVDKIDPETKKQALDPQTKKPQTERKTVNVPILEVSGYVINDAAGVANVAPLSEATSKDAEFGKHFVFDNVSKLEDTEFKSFAVRSFTLQYKIQVNSSVEATP